MVGGGAASEAVRRIAPAVLGLPVVVPEPGEYVADGACRQAAWALSGERASRRRRGPLERDPDATQADATQLGARVRGGTPAPRAAPGPAAPAALDFVAGHWTKLVRPA